MAGIQPPFILRGEIPMSRHTMKKLRSELSIVVSPPSGRESVAVELRKVLGIMTFASVEWLGLAEGPGPGELVIYLRATGSSYGEAQDLLDEYVEGMLRRMTSSRDRFEQGSNLLLPA